MVSLATTAISIAEADDPNLPTLWSKVFKQQLELGHNEEAYNAMISNPDASRWVLIAGVATTLFY